nr:hypothetical protein [Candidatus Sigynarchaeum springense]
MDGVQMADAESFLKAIADETRLQIIEYVKGSPRTAEEIRAFLGKSLPFTYTTHSPSGRALIAPVLHPAAGPWILRLLHGYAPALKCLARIGASSGR